MVLPAAVLAAAAVGAIRHEARLLEARQARQGEALLRSVEEGLREAARARLAAVEARLVAALAAGETPAAALAGFAGGVGSARVLDGALHQVAPARGWRAGGADLLPIPSALDEVLGLERAGRAEEALARLAASPLAGLGVARNVRARLLYALGRLDEALAEDRALQALAPAAGLPLAWVACEREAAALAEAGRAPEARGAAVRSLELLVASQGAGGAPGALTATLGRLVALAGPALEPTLAARAEALAREARLAADLAAWGELASGARTAPLGPDAHLVPLASEGGWAAVGPTVRAPGGPLRPALVLPRAALERLLQEVVHARGAVDPGAFRIELVDPAGEAAAIAEAASAHALPGGLSLVARAGESTYEAALAGRRATQRLALAAVLLLVVIGGSLLTYRAAQRASELARLRNEFTASVTHELRTPIASIRAMSEILALGKVPSEDRRAEYYRAISEETQRLGRLVEDVLDVARVESDGFKPEVELCDPGEAVRAATDAFRASPVSKGLGVNFAAEPGLPRVALDRRLLARALENLLVNAVKYGGEQPDMRVEVRRAGEGVEVCVSDRGPGIDPTDLERVLRPFERGRGVADVPGAGLGLAIVAAILEAHRGAVAVESVRGMGTSFRLRLPAAPDQALEGSGEAP